MENKKNLKVKKKVRKVKKNIRKEANRITRQCKCNNENEDKDLGLARFSYADFVVMSSVIAYGIVDSVSLEDLGIILSFLGMVTSDMSLLATKVRIENARESQIGQQSEEDVIPEQISEESIVDETLNVGNSTFLQRHALPKERLEKSSNIKKRKRIKKIKKIRKK